MASVKKTMKSSETKKAKQPGPRTPKVKASKRLAVSKARKAAVTPALTAKKAAASKRAAKTAAAKVAGKKVSAKLAAKALAAKKLAAKVLAAKQLAAKKSAQKAKLKTQMATAATSRATAAKNKNKNPIKKKVQASPRALAPRGQTASVAKQATVRRAKPELARATAAKRIAAAKRVEAVRKAAVPKTPAHKGLRREAAPAVVAARQPVESKPVESKTGAVQKPAAGKDAAAALLAFKRNVARLTEARKRAAAAPRPGPTLNSSNLPLEPSEPMIKQAKKDPSMETASGADTNSVRPSATVTARETARGGAKGTGAPMHAKAPAKLLVSKLAPSIENRPVALAPAASDASQPDTGQANTAEAAPAERPSAVAPKPAKIASPQRQLFKSGEFVVYPSHGVGQIVAIEEQEVAGFKLELYVISFIKDKMMLKVPTPKAASVGMRRLADATAVKMALDTLAGRARIKRTMWSRRAQEYEAKINSGDLNAIAEVVRDLYRSDTQPEQSYSERQLYEAALDRMTREIVVVQRLTETESLKVIEAQLQKGPRRGKAEDIDAEEAEIEEAA
jgi:CarD family transcriptional regulator